MGIFGMARTTGKGPYRHQTAVWKGGLAVACGDFVFRDTDGYDKPVSNLAWNTTLAQTETDLQPKFRGVSAVRRTTLQTADGTQATDGPILASGEFTFPCDALAAAQKPGDYVGVAKDTGNNLANQKVVIVATAATAIGKLTRDAAVGAQELTFVIFPTDFNPTAIG